MKNTTTKTVPPTIEEYVRLHADDICNYADRAVGWSGRSLNAIVRACTQYPHFSDAVKQIKDPLTRADVRAYYDQDLYLGFVATLLWGHKHTNYVKYFHLVASMPREEVVKKLQLMIDDLSKDPANMSHDRWDGLARGGKSHIPGLGVSFFTKVLFFTCHIHGQGRLILDTKMWEVAKALRKMEGHPVTYNFGRVKDNDYMRYNVAMFALAKKYNLDAGQLEAYLFDHIDEVKPLA